MAAELEPDTPQLDPELQKDLLLRMLDNPNAMNQLLRNRQWTSSSAKETTAGNPQEARSPRRQPGHELDWSPTRAGMSRAGSHDQQNNTRWGTAMNPDDSAARALSSEDTDRLCAELGDPAAMQRVNLRDQLQAHDLDHKPLGDT